MGFADCVAELITINCGNWAVLRGAAIKAQGRRVSRPNIARFGEIPVDECFVIRYADRTEGKRAGQSCGLSRDVHLNICNSVLLARSVKPLERG